VQSALSGPVSIMTTDSIIDRAVAKWAYSDLRFTGSQSASLVSNYNT